MSDPSGADLPPPADPQPAEPARRPPSPVPQGPVEPAAPSASVRADFDGGTPAVVLTVRMPLALADLDDLRDRWSLAADDRLRAAKPGPPDGTAELANVNARLASTRDELALAAAELAGHEDALEAAVRAGGDPAAAEDAATAARARIATLERRRAVLEAHAKEVLAGRRRAEREAEAASAGALKAAVAAERRATFDALADLVRPRLDELAVAQTVIARLTR